MSPPPEGDHPPAVPGTLLSVRLELLTDSPYQPRQDYAPEALQELADSIRVNGVIAPLCVRPLPGGSYEIIGGHRRKRAAKLAGKTEVPCVVREADDHLARRLALLDNLAREDLTPWEEGSAYAGLVAEGMTVAEVAHQTARSVETVASRIAIAQEVGEKARDAFRRGEVGVAHLAALASLPDRTVYVQECPVCQTTNEPDAVACCACGRDLSATLAFPWGNPQEVALKAMRGTQAHAAEAIARQVADHYGLNPGTAVQRVFDLAAEVVAPEVVESRTALDRHLAAVSKLEHWLAQHGPQVRRYTGDQLAAARAQAEVAARIVRRVVDAITEAQAGRVA